MKESKYVIHNEAYEPDDEKTNGQLTFHVNGKNFDKEEQHEEVTIAEKHDDDDREGWGNKIEFLLAIVGYAVGLGNVWRFPYLAQKNGGGAFIIPYLLSLVTMGVPMFFMELACGQRIRKGPVHVWNKLCPSLSGIGMASVIISFLVGLYYNMIVAWCFYYLFISFQKELPYAKCPTIPCTPEICNSTFTNQTDIIAPECAKSSPTEYFYYRTTLGVTDSIEISGNIDYKLALCLLLSWIIVYAITCKGVKSTGKIVYFTALFPYVVLTIFLVRGLLLEGAVDGIKHMFIPDFDKLLQAETWLDASTQIFYSMGLGFGSLVSMASYNKINNNIVRDALLVSLINCSTSLYGGIVVFSILGYKATRQYNACIESQAITNKQCDLQTYLNQVAQGPGLVFIAFTEAISTMDVPQLWSVLFFSMILTLGVGSMIGTYECVRTSFVDLKLLPFRQEITGFILCSISFGFGLLFCQQSGSYWLQMFDSYSGTLGLLTCGLCEVICVMYIYGFKKFQRDIEFMLGSKPNLYWKITWLVVTPLLTALITVASLYALITKVIKYEAWIEDIADARTKEYPDWGVALCFVLIGASVVFIPVCAILVRLDLFHLQGQTREEGEMKDITTFDDMDNADS